MSITCEVLNNKEFFELVYGKSSLPSDRTIFKRIKYFDVHDISYSNKISYFVVLKENNKVIGLAKLAHYKMDNMHENEYSLAYLSIDINYRNKGYTRLMCEKMFEFIKKINLDLKSSSYTYVGFVKLRKLLIEYSKKHEVNFSESNDSNLITPKEMYDSNLNMIGEYGNV